MNVTGLRLSAALTCLLMLAGNSSLPAASRTIRGHLTQATGPLPAGSRLRATPIGGGTAVNVFIGPATGDFVFSDMPGGTYLFEVLGPEGRPLAPGLMVPIPDRTVTIELRIEANGRLVELERAQVGRRLGRGARWGIVLGSVALGGILAFGGGCDDADASPSSPSSGC